MSTIRFRRFTKPQFLREIGRPLLTQLFGKFAAEFSAHSTALPAESLADEDYFASLARVALAPEALPVSLVEALTAIEEMATPEGQERLETALSRAGLGLTFHEESSHGDIAVQVYLAQPTLLVAQCNEARLGRLTAFEYFGSKGGNAEKLPSEVTEGLHGPRKAEMLKSENTQLTPALSPSEAERGGGGAGGVTPTKEKLEALAGDLDVWFGEHNRGRSMVWIESQCIEGEWHFLVQHGDAFTRTTRMEPRRRHRMHFRPPKDDVVVYTPKRDEIRVHAGTKGEKELYRRAFGQQLFGDADYFSERMAFSLEVLREDCAAVLDPRGLPGVSRIVLREVRLAWGHLKREFMVRGGLDIHGAARARGREAIPDYGTVKRAGFDFYFAGQKKARRVEVRLPNTVKMGRGCEARVVHEWLSARGIRVRASQGRQKSEDRSQRTEVRGRTTDNGPLTTDQ